MVRLLINHSFNLPMYFIDIYWIIDTYNKCDWIIDTYNKINSSKYTK